MRATTCLILLALLFCGCASTPIWEVSVLNMTDAPVVLKRAKTRSTEIAPKKGYNKWKLKPGETLLVLQGDKTLEQHTPSELGLEDGKDGAAFLVVGGKSDVVLADYSDFYVKEGEQKKADPKIKIVANLRHQISTPIHRGDLISWPHQSLAETRYDGGGVKDRRFLRVVGLTDKITDDQLEDYLDYELKRQIQEMPK